MFLLGIKVLHAVFPHFLSVVLVYRSATRAFSRVISSMDRHREKNESVVVGIYKFRITFQREHAYTVKQAVFGPLLFVQVGSNVTVALAPCS